MFQGKLHMLRDRLHMLWGKLHLHQGRLNLHRGIFVLHRGKLKMPLVRFDSDRGRFDPGWGRAKREARSFWNRRIIHLETSRHSWQAPPSKSDSGLMLIWGEQASKYPWPCFSCSRLHPPPAGTSRHS